MEITSPPYAPIPPSLELPTPKRPILIDVYEPKTPSSSGDHIDISDEARSLDASRTLVSSTLSQLVREGDPSEDVRKRVEARIDEVEDPSADAASRAILRGVEDIVPHDRPLAERASVASAALERGVRETRTRLAAERRLPEDFDQTAQRTVELVHEGLRQGESRDRVEVSTNAREEAATTEVDE